MTETLKQGLLMFLLAKSTAEVRLQARNWCFDSGVYEVDVECHVTYCCVEVILPFLNCLLCCRRRVFSNQFKRLNIQHRLVPAPQKRKRIAAENSAIQHRLVPASKKRKTIDAEKTGVEENGVSGNSSTHPEEYICTQKTFAAKKDPEQPEQTVDLGNCSAHAEEYYNPPGPHSRFWNQEWPKGFFYFVCIFVRVVTSLRG